jgi:hypothetical protein
VTAQRHTNRKSTGLIVVLQFLFNPGFIAGMSRPEYHLLAFDADHIRAFLPRSVSAVYYGTITHMRESFKEFAAGT